MSASWKGLLDRVRPKKYGRKTPLILINGLAEQAGVVVPERPVLGPVLRRPHSPT